MYVCIEYWQKRDRTLSKSCDTLHFLTYRFYFIDMVYIMYYLSDILGVMVGLAHSRANIKSLQIQQGSDSL